MRSLMKSSFRSGRSLRAAGVGVIASCLLASAAAAGPLAELAAKMPLRFEENAGQVKEAGVRFVARGRGYRLSLGAREAVFDLGETAGAAALRLRLAGGAEHPVLAGIDPLPAKSNYLLGRDPRGWHAGVASFAGVRYAGVYPGTDLVFSGDERQVEQSFYLAAGAEPQRIRLVWEGAASAEVGKEGELTLRTPGRELTASRPVAYQVVDGERRTVECRYDVRAGQPGAPEVGFALGGYDRRLPLVIDPVFGSGMLLGGGATDVAHAIGVDADGNIYIAGSTSSTEFIGTISPGGVQSSNAGDFDGFVVKIDPTGTTLLYSTYFGGAGLDEIEGIAVDAAGNAYLTGYTLSSDFPVTTGALQGTSGGDRDAFVAKLGPTGATLLYSTYLGGTGTDFGDGIAIDATGNAYVTGSTGSTDFPGVTAGSLQPANAGGPSDAYVTAIDATGSAIVYSTYLGGDEEDQAYSIALDPAGGAVIAGATCSETFPVTAGVIEPESPGVSCEDFLYDGFVARLSPAGTALVYATFLGGEDNDVARSVAVDAAGGAYVTGYTRSTAFTGVTAGSFQPGHADGYAAFLTRLGAAGDAAGYSTFLGGDGSFGYAVAVDAAANAYVTGVTRDGYPIVNATTLMPFHSGNPDDDGFVTKIDAAGAVRYSTYSGGPQFVGYAIAFDGPRQRVYVTGSSGPSGSEQVPLARILPSAALAITKTADVEIVDPGGKITYTLTYENYGELTATGATLTETVPENTVFKPLQSTAGWSCTPNEDAGATCTLALGTVAPGGSGSATFTVKVKAKLSVSGWEIDNTACAHPGNACAETQTPTTAAPILSITKTARFNEAKPGNVLRYTIKLFNTGNQDAAPVAITDTVPGNAVFNPSTSTAGWTCEPDGSAGSVCTFPVGTLAAGGQVTVDFAATLSTLYSNTACGQVVPFTPELTAGRRKAIAPPVCSTATTPLK
jgi:uncharacterized repeat protein (TIGR01451 family)